MQRLGKPDAYADALLELITRAVEDRLRGGPIATQLSGGLDSSAVTVLAARLCRAAGRPPVPTFTWLPSRRPTPLPASWVSSYSRVQSVAEQERLRVSYSTLSAADIEAVLRRDGAYPDGLEFPVNEALYREAREQGARVLLTGALGDQFASYNGFHYESHLFESGRWLRLLGLCRREGISVLRRAVAGVRLDLAEVRLSLKRRCWESGRDVNLTNPEFRRQADLPSRPARSWFGSVRHRQLFFLQTEMHVVGFETNAAAAARHGLECRHPLADRRVVEFVLGVPPDQFRRNGQVRWLMRNALRTVLPEHVLNNWEKADPAVTTGPGPTRPMVEALPALRRRLTAQPSRMRYLDMAKILAGVDEAIRNEARPPQKIVKALQFLCR